MRNCGWIPFTLWCRIDYKGALNRLEHTKLMDSILVRHPNQLERHVTSNIRNFPISSAYTKISQWNNGHWFHAHSINLNTFYKKSIVIAYTDKIPKIWITFRLYLSLKLLTRHCLEWDCLKATLITSFLALKEPNAWRYSFVHNFDFSENST